MRVYQLSDTYIIYTDFSSGSTRWAFSACLINEGLTLFDRGRGGTGGAIQEEFLFRYNRGSTK